MRIFIKPLLSGLLMVGLSLTIGPATAQTVNSWLTTGDRANLLQPQASASFSSSTPGTATTITVDEGTTYQIMDGFGGAMTGSAAYVMNHYLNASQRDALMTDLFSTSGIHLSFMRHTIGASDFSPPGDYTYDDVAAGQTDTGLGAFSIAKDLTDVVPMLKEAIAKNSSLRILGSPWSAPAWMKSNANLRNGGSLNSSAYQAYANYFVKYVQAYAAQGVPVYAMTLQNEPQNATGSYMSMLMQSSEEAAFLKVIGPAFRSASLNTKLIVYDHNWDTPNYPNSIFADATAAQYAAGSAWHGYSDPSGISNMTSVHNAYPSKDIWFTEITGNASGDFAGDFKWHMTNIIIGNTRNWAKSALEWNLALDQNSAPVNGGYTNGRGVVTINSSTGAITRNEEYYALGHASKFVDQGAVRIASNSVAGGIENVAFRNPDGSKVVVAVNNSSAAITFKIQWGSQSVNYTLPAGAAATYKWAGATTTTPTVSASGTLSGFSTTTGTPSAPQSYAVSGSYLTGALTVGPLAGYEFSKTGGTPYSNSLSLAPSSGTVASTTISVRLTGAAAGTFNGSIANASAGAATQNVAASGSVTAPNTTPTITASGTLASFTTTTGTASAAQTYTVSAINLSSGLAVGPLAGYEFSKTGGTPYAASLSLTPSGGTVASTTVSVRLAGTTAGTFSGNIPNASTGAATRNVAASGTVNVPSTTSGITSGHIYKVLSQNSGKALDVRDVSLADGASLQQWTYGGGNNQKWRVEDMGSGYYRFTSISSGKAMEVAGSSTANGAGVQQWSWSGNDNQRWSLTLQGDGSYQVLNKLSGKALDVAGVSLADGANIQQWDWSGSGGSNQKWLFTDLGTAARAALATTNSAADASLQVYPTVADQTLRVAYQAPAAQQLALRLLDLTGHVVVSQPDNSVVPGENSLTVPVAKVSAGMYLLQVTSADGQFVRRVIITH